MTNQPFTMIHDDEEHGAQFSSKRRARMAASIETQRTGIRHTHYLTTTYRQLSERMCWTIIPVVTARKMLEIS